MKGDVRGVSSLRTTVLLYGCLFIVGLVTASAAIYFVAARSLVLEVDTRLSTEGAAVIGWSSTVDLPRIEGRIAKREQFRRTDDLSYLLIDKAGKRLAGKLSMRMPKPGFSDVDFTDRVEGIDHGRALAIALPDGSRLLLVADYGPVEDLNDRLLQVGGVALCVAIAIGTLAGFALSRSIARRIEANTRIARSIMSGDMDQRMPFDGTGGAFDRQATVLNAMLDRIQELMIGLRQISSDVAHDLRTPLALLRTNIAALVTAEPNTVQEGDLLKILGQSDALLALFKAILRIAEVEAGSRRAHFGRMALTGLVNDLVATFAPLIAENSRSLSVGRADLVEIDGDRELIAQALINVIENAAKHTPAGTQIVVDVCAAGAEALLVVRDDGPGIAVTDRQTALRRFGRLDESRSTPGNGLGLSLVDSIARLHGGEFTLGDAQPGLVATMHMPRAAPK